MVHINFRDPRPIYEQVRDGFRQLILSGALLPDEKMPSVRELAARLAINPNTIQRAYRELEAQGYICSAPGRGSFVCAGTQAQRARAAELLGQMKELAEELRLLGVSREEMEAALKGGESDEH